MDILQRIFLCGVVPVIKVAEAADALPLCSALLAGGIDIAEITFRSSAAAEAIALVSDSLPDMLTGAGTVHSVHQAEEAVEAGARFIVSPGLNPEVVRYCRRIGIPVLPGVSGPTDLETALELGLDTVKFFPAENLGGLAAIKAISAAYGEMRFMPTGGINENNLTDYVRHPRILACGGSWMVSDALVAARDWDGITALTKKAVLRLHGFELAHIGINTGSPEEAERAAHLFSALFGWEYRPGANSIFAGTGVEMMKAPYYGTNGHIGIRCNNAARARAYFEKAGFGFREESVRPVGGPLKTVYFSDEIAGFALHLMGV
ncbi:MAG: bifunctional 4-hydroxy-2-oxoglutarate aldolase/2-dehydro-3-deoxy-phosphogluconate aldolase [Clostridia bacterium]|nr:bifunctional 4-hydroxy-2-oxoglutarate aldolase/2-dehydro-3-deoxy-phosphogluconate aldolase [Clostridia bacterium]